MPHQYCPGEGDPADVSDCQHLHRRVGAAAAPPAPVDPQTCPVRPLPLHRPHLHRRKPDVRPHGSPPQGAGERACVCGVRGRVNKCVCVWVTICRLQGSADQTVDWVPGAGGPDLSQMIFANIILILCFNLLRIPGGPVLGN